MAALATLLAALAVLHVSRADEHPLTVSIGPCPDVTNVDWTESINAYLRRLPNNVTLPELFVSNEGGVLDFGHNHLYGLGNLWPYKRFHSYCVGTETFIEVIAFAREPLAAEMEWKSCGTSSGRIGMKISSSKLRLILRAIPTADEPTRVQLRQIHGDSLEDPWIYVSGAPKELTSMIRVLSVLLKPHIKEAWATLLRMDAQFLLESHPNI